MSRANSATVSFRRATVSGVIVAVVTFVFVLALSTWASIEVGDALHPALAPSKSSHTESTTTTTGQGDGTGATAASGTAPTPAQTTSKSETKTESSNPPAADTSPWALVISTTPTRIGLGLLIAIALAFIAAFATQRILLGRFGIKVGPLEIADIAPPITGAQALPAKKAVEAISTVRRSDIPGRANLVSNTPEPPWWSREPTVSDPRERALYYAGALEAAIQELGREQSGQYLLTTQTALSVLYWQPRFSNGAVPISIARGRDQFLAGLRQLLAIGERLRQGAKIDKDTEQPLFDAYAHALQVLKNWFQPEQAGA